MPDAESLICGGCKRAIGRDEPQHLHTERFRREIAEIMQELERRFGRRCPGFVIRKVARSEDKNRSYIQQGGADDNEVVIYLAEKCWGCTATRIATLSHECVHFLHPVRW